MTGVQSRDAAPCRGGRTGITALVLLSPAANADPSDDCDTCTHDPQQWNGPLLPTWDTPHSNEGWTTLPQLCDPVTYQCSGMVGAVAAN
jgi:hypothetical protein